MAFPFWCFLGLYAKCALHLAYNKPNADALQFSYASIFRTANAKFFSHLTFAFPNTNALTVGHVGVRVLPQINKFIEVHYYFSLDSILYCREAFRKSNSTTSKKWE